MVDKILVFIPCYNCGPQIGRVLRQFNDCPKGQFSEVLVLDNGSKDDTVTQATQAALAMANLKVTIGRNQSNYNLGGSHKVAFKYALDNGFTHVVVLHGDDQGDIRDIYPVLKAGHHRVQDACLGARFMQGSKLIGYSPFRIFGNHVFNALFTLGTGQSIKDLGSGLNIFGKRIFEDAGVLTYADDLRFNIYLLLGLIRKGVAFKYFPISWREDDQVSNVKMTSQALKTLALLSQSIFSAQHFWSTDHRDVKHVKYDFDPL